MQEGSAGEDREASGPGRIRLRREYARGGLDEADLAATWLGQLARWLAEASGPGGPREPNAAVLATADASGAPSARTVLIKQADEAGLVLATNRASRKGQDLAANPRAALVLPWLELERQVVVTGTVAPTSDAESDAIFVERPRGAQIGAWASPQSQVVAGRAELEARRAEALARFPGEVPRPPHWGGYRLAPSSVEFWQGRPDRLHDRLRFRLEGADWVVERLAP